MKRPVLPVFIISFNILSALKRAITSYKQLIDSQLIVYDTGSTYEPLLNYYRILEGQGVVVHRDRKKVEKPDDLNSVDETVQEWIASYPDTEHYIVTDSDIELMEGCETLPEFYSFILREFQVSVVGPMLRIDDIPDTYPLKERVLEGHQQNYWNKTPIDVSWSGAKVGVQHAVIDTTFGMYSSKNPFRRWQQGIRTREPFLARHLDWYIDPSNMTEDQKLYLRMASTVSHWGGAWLAKNLETGWVPD